MEAKATLRYARVAPNKARQVIANVRDLPVGEAREILVLETKAVARDIRKVLDSAVANAENNHGLDADELFVTRAVVDEGPVLRRFRPRAQGRATRIRKRTSHITITVGTGEDDSFAGAVTGSDQTQPVDAEGATRSGGEQ
jgi:large subunit ribosomal protein L22